jgi:4-amino-4-deoxy-L-arabinose transferase-like glycosyltransferase
VFEVRRGFMTEGHSTIQAPAQERAVLSRPLFARVRLSGFVAILMNVLIGQLPLFLILCSGAFLRLWTLNRLGFNSDEAVYAGQAASLAKDPELAAFFPVVRAHPMLFQSILAFVYLIHVSDILARVISVAFGMGTIVLVYLLGRLLYGRRVGQVAALIIALMPYHVVVSRQVLLDGPMTFFATLTLYLLAKFAVTQRPALLYATGAGIGLVFLSKETGFVLITAVYAFIALTPQLRVRIRDIVIALICTFATVFTFPISVVLAGRASTAQSYIVWQIFRRPNHSMTFYPDVVPPAVGWFVIIAAVAGLVIFRRERGWTQRLLVCWIVVPVLAFELWPVKGFQYLLPAAPAIAVLAARTLVLWSPLARLKWRRQALATNLVRAGMILVVVVSLAIPSWNRIQPSTSGEFLAGSGGVPGGREAGAWIRDNVPENALFLAVGPSMANIIQFYGHRKAYGLSVSPNPLHRNPSYEAIVNPDSQIRNSDLQYLVYDSFSAARSPFFGQQLLSYVQAYHGRVVHTESITVTNADGTVEIKPLIVIYEVRP